MSKKSRSIKFNTFKSFIKQPDNFVSSLLFSAGILFILQWLFALDQVVGAVRQLGFAELPRFLIDGFVNFLQFALDDYEPTALLAISLLLGTTIVMLSYMFDLKNKNQKNKNRLKKTFIVALVGSGCASCSSSILSPILSGLAVSTASNIANTVSFLSLTAGLVLASKSFSQTLAVLANIQVKGQYK